MWINKIYFVSPAGRCSPVHPSYAIEILTLAWRYFSQGFFFVCFFFFSLFLLGSFPCSYFTDQDEIWCCETIHGEHTGHFLQMRLCFEVKQLPFYRLHKIIMLACNSMFMNYCGSNLK